VEIFAPPFISTFCSTSNGNILPFFACREKTKNPDFAWKSGFYCLLLFFKVVPPGIEPGTQGFSVLCSPTALKASPNGSTFNATN
jgi:hypothetical protein